MITSSSPISDSERKTISSPTEEDSPSSSTLQFNRNQGPNIFVVVAIPRNQGPNIFVGVAIPLSQGPNIFVGVAIPRNQGPNIFVGVAIPRISLILLP